MRSFDSLTYEPRPTDWWSMRWPTHWFIKRKISTRLEVIETETRPRRLESVLRERYYISVNHLPILWWVATQVDIRSILACMKSCLCHFHRVFFVLDRLLQVSDQPLLHCDVLADLQHHHQTDSVTTRTGNKENRTKKQNNRCVYEQCAYKGKLCFSFQQCIFVCLLCIVHNCLT